VCIFNRQRVIYCAVTDVANTQTRQKINTQKAFLINEMENCTMNEISFRAKRSLSTIYCLSAGKSLCSLLSNVIITRIGSRPKARYTLPVFTGRVHGRHFGHRLCTELKNESRYRKYCIIAILLLRPPPPEEVGSIAISMSVCVCLSVCMSVRSYISKTTSKLMKFSVYVTCGRGSVLL